MASGARLSSRPKVATIPRLAGAARPRPARVRQGRRRARRPAAAAAARGARRHAAGARGGARVRAHSQRGRGHWCGAARHCGWWRVPSALLDDPAPCARLAPPGAWAAPTHPEHSPSIWEACGGLFSSPRATPKLRISHPRQARGCASESTTRAARSALRSTAASCATSSTWSSRPSPLGWASISPMSGSPRPESQPKR